MAKQYVPEGVWLACDKGTCPSTFRVSHNEHTKIYGSAMATEADLLPFFNIKPMGICSVLKSMCVPAVLKWDDPQDGVMINSNRMLKEDSTCKCMIGGKIDIHYDKASASAACAFGEIKMPSEYIKEGFDSMAENMAKSRAERDAILPSWMKSVTHAADWVDDLGTGLVEGAVNGVVGLGETVYQVAQDPVGTVEAIGGMAVKAGEAVGNAYTWASDGDNWSNAYNGTKEWASDSQNWKDAAGSAWESTKEAGEWVTKNPRAIGNTVGQFIPDAVAAVYTGGGSAALSAERIAAKEGLELAAEAARAEAKAAKALLEREAAATLAKDALQQGEKKIGKVVVKNAKELELEAERAAKAAEEKAAKEAEEKCARDQCTKNGHPVDMATGEMFIEAVGFDLPGIIPIVWEAIWFNSSIYQGPLGSGWSHSYDQFLIADKDANLIIHRTEDGRDITYPYLDEESSSYYKRSEKTTLSRQSDGYKLYNHIQGLQYIFNYNDAAQKHILTGIYNSDGDAIKFNYENGLLARIIDSCRRVLILTYNEARQLTQVALLDDSQLLPPETLIQYSYNEHGCLTAIIYPLKNGQYFHYNAYKQIIKHKVRAGIDFYFEYNGTGPDAKCPRTWGDGNVLGYNFTFEEGKTLSTDSLGHTTIYFHKGGLVYKTIDPCGNITYNKYNQYRELISQTDALRNTTVYAYDDKGNLTHTFLPNGATIATKYDEQKPACRKLPMLIATPGSGTYDEAGHITKQVDPLEQQTVYRYNGNGVLTHLTDALDRTTAFYYNSQGQLIIAQAPNGQRTQWQYNHRGQCTATIYPNDTARHLYYDAAGHIIKNGRAGWQHPPYYL